MKSDRRQLMAERLNKQAEKYATTHSRQSDAEFLKACQLPDDPAVRNAALGVRRAIAELGEVDAGFIHAEARFDTDIMLLPFWDSLDTIVIVLKLEEQIGVKIENAEATAIRNPDFDGGMRVRDFTHDILQVLHEKLPR